MNKRIIVILIFSMTVLLGQSMDSTVYKKPKTAFFYSLVPGCGQMYKLPTKGFRFISEEVKIRIDWATIDLLSSFGYFVECDLYYQVEIHNNKKFPSVLKT